MTGKSEHEADKHAERAKSGTTKRVKGARSHLATRRAAANNEDYQQKRTFLIKVAAEQFHLQGVSETTLADIARASGLDRASVYYYFSNKEELFAAVLRTALADRVAEHEQILRLDLPPDEMLRMLIVSQMRAYDRHYPYLYVYIQQDVEQLALAPEVKRWIVQMSEDSVKVWRDVVAEGIRLGIFLTDLPAGIVAYSMIGTVAWSHRWYRPNGSVGADAIGRGLADLLINGLKGGQP